MHVRRLFLVFVAATMLGGRARDTTAQAIKWSQSGTVTQMLGDTEIVIRYSRPVARGRELFGALVPWGKTWNPGADSATTIAFSTGVQVDGHPLPAGKYSVWMIPFPEAWTVILSRAADVFHTPYPEGQDALRLELLPESGQHMETLTFHFPVVDGPRAVLTFQWGETMVHVPMEIELEEP